MTFTSACSKVLRIMFEINESYFVWGGGRNFTYTTNKLALVPIRALYTVLLTVPVGRSNEEGKAIEEI